MPTKVKDCLHLRRGVCAAWGKVGTQAAPFLSREASLEIEGLECEKVQYEKVSIPVVCGGGVRCYAEVCRCVMVTGGERLSFENGRTCSVHLPSTCPPTNHPERGVGPSGE